MFNVLLELLGDVVNVMWLCRRGDDAGWMGHPAVSVLAGVLAVLVVAGTLCRLVMG